MLSPWWTSGDGSGDEERERELVEEEKKKGLREHGAILDGS